MNPYKAIDTYFKLKSLDDAMGDGKAVRDYAKKVKKKSEDQSWWDRFKWPDKYSAMIDKATKAAKKAEKTFKQAVGKTPDWPRDQRFDYFNQWFNSAVDFGRDSVDATEDFRSFAINMSNYSSALDHLLKQTQDRQIMIKKYHKTSKACAEYSDFLTKTFAGFVSIASVSPGTVTQATWFALSENCGQFYGHAQGCANALKKLDASHDKTIKLCKKHIKAQNDWMILAFKDSSKLPAIKQKAKKAKGLKKK